MSIIPKILCGCLLVCLFLAAESAEPPECYTYKFVFPNCTCLPADDNNNKGVVDCSGLGLTSVPTPQATFTDTIYELRLNNNSIVTLRNNSFSGLNIRALDLRDNKIAVVEDSCFQGLANSLLYLYIDGNGTSDPPKVALSKLISLTELTMRNYGTTQLSEVTDKRLFVTFFNLQKLTLDSWKLASIDQDALSGPKNLASLTLNKQPLVNLPLNMLNAGNGVKLKQLTISNTLIDHISDYAFQKITGLVDLDLSHNHINKLDPVCFDNLADSLSTLNLSGNNFLHGETLLEGLKNLPKLSVLDFSSNEIIISIPDLSQLGSTVPLKLYLGNNKITALSKNSLVSFGSLLHTLDLSNNSINSLDSEAFSSLTSLVVLNLSYQKLPTNIWTAIKPLIKLEVLNFSSTDLKSIPEFIFENMTRLRVLDLSSSSTSKFPNQLTSVIKPAVFAGPHTSFKEFYLSGSSVTKLSPCLFHGYISFPITMSLFGGSYLACDCDIYWLWMKIRIGNITFLPGHEPRCSPSSIKLLSELQQSEFCSELPSVQCTDYYKYPAPNITLAPGTTNIHVSWKINEPTSNIKIQSLKVEIDEDDKVLQKKNLSPSIRTYTFNDLKNNTQYTVCVTAVYSTDSSLTCSSVKTLSSAQLSPQSGDSNNVGIIVGCVIGGVVLLAIIAAIVYILFIRRKPQQKSVDLPEQPRKFHKSELPTMTGESRSFAKQKKVNGSDSKDGNMQIVAISDGHTGPPRVGRAQALSSQSSGGKPKSISSVSSSDKATYENDRGALPPVPNTKKQSNQEGYINMGYKRDSYDEIDPKREVSV